MSSKIYYRPPVCQCCGQSTEYLLPIDNGTIEILKAFIETIKRLGKNEVHPARDIYFAKEGESDWGLTNVSRPRFHGLVAKIKDKKGYYCLTNKGVDFLKGKEVSRYAIISKSEHKNIGYFEPDKYKVNIHDFDPAGERWECPRIQVVDGRVVDMGAITGGLNNSGGQAKLFNFRSNNF